MNDTDRLNWLEVDSARLGDVRRTAEREGCSVREAIDRLFERNRQKGGSTRSTNSRETISVAPARHVTADGRVSSEPFVGAPPGAQKR
jgi:hypothetical protein